MIRDDQGNLYGTASGDNGGYGNGAVYQITSTGTLKLLYQFTGGADGLCPYSTLVRDSSGNLYGTTYRGGTFGYGTVYEVTPAGTESVLYSFTGGADGSNPVGELVRDAGGNLYGTTTGGGTVYGTVFKLSSDGTETVLHSFNVTDGYYPATGLLRDQRGNLYGTTIFGGKYNKGTIYKVEKNGKESVLYSFTGQADGGSPDGALIRDKAGNLYGTTTSGGAFNSECLSGCGVVYKLTP